jgi:hypothetical protein
MSVVRKILLFIGVTVTILAASCGDDRIIPPEGDGYVIQGVLLYNSDSRASLGHLKLTKDGEALTDLEVAIEGQAVPHAGQGLYRASSPGLSLSPGDTHTVTIESATGDPLFVRDFVLPDTFTAIITDPAHHIYNTGGNVALTWNGSTYSLGYVVTVVPEDSAGVVVEYAVPATGLTNTWTIPPDAFQKSDGTLVLDTYNIYVLAYRETFLDPEDHEVFFPLPEGVFDTGNISTDTFTGTIGVGTLSIGDYIIADKQQ